MKDLDEKIRVALTTAIAIMDEKGRRNQEGNSVMLWESDWNSVRYILLKLVDPSVEDGIERV